jgi:hypothetical protein
MAEVTHLTRARAIDAVAKRLALFDAWSWQRSPTMAQAKRQAQYERRARELVELIEHAMLDWEWSPNNTPPRPRQV